MEMKALVALGIAAGSADAVVFLITGNSPAGTITLIAVVAWGYFLKWMKN